jgi:hypothetical protein
MKLPFASKRCGCRSCGQYFRSVRAFDKHRSGAYPDRRCLTAAEMLEAGLELHRLGYWRLLSSGNPWAAGTPPTQQRAGTVYAQ